MPLGICCYTCRAHWKNSCQTEGQLCGKKILINKNFRIVLLSEKKCPKVSKMKKKKSYHIFLLFLKLIKNFFEYILSLIQDIYLNECGSPMLSAIPFSRLQPKKCTKRNQGNEETGLRISKIYSIHFRSIVQRIF